LIPKGTHDRMLTYVSERGRGTWAQFKQTFDWLAGEDDDPAAKAWIAARNLSSLGHMEIDWDAGTWSAAPPLVTLLPRSGARALITGARTRHLRHQLEAAVEDADLWLDELDQADAPRPGSPPRERGPSTLLLSCRRHQDAEKLASRIGASYTYAAASMIAGLLPPLAAYARLFDPGDLPAGFPAERFDPSALTWAPADAASEAGLYRCRTFSGHVHVLRNWDGRSLRVVREHGVYEVLRWEQRTVLAYDRARETLLVPATADLPVLQARAATLSSGRLPRLLGPAATPQLAYRNVAAAVAEQIAASLSQELAAA
jgi:hypothetical protein